MSKPIEMNRRQALGSLMACATPLSGALALPPVTQECLLENESIEFRVRIREGKVALRRLVNKLANETIDLPTTDFALEFDTGSVVTPDMLSVTDVTRAGDHFGLVYSSAEGLRVRVQYQLPRRAGYVRKQIEIQGENESVKRKLMRADLDNWMGVKRPWKSMKADRLRFGSHPIYCDTLWAGVEFVAAFNEYSDEGLVLRSRPGGKPVTSDWAKLRATVMGVAEPNGAHSSFLRYIEDVRLRPARLVACYNSWWSLPEIFHENEFVPLMQRLKECLFEKEGVFFDLVTGDMGWSDPRTIWKIDKVNQPDDLNRMVEIVESAHGKPGLWMSPSHVYFPVIDYEWAKRNGYVVVPGQRPSHHPFRGLSLADPRYRSETEESLKWLVREKRLGHIKFDGFIAREEEAHHGLLPGDDSVEPLAEFSLELIGATLEANSELVTEPTFMNSHANYISPWIIQHADSVWGNAGGDCPLGLGPAPDYREAHTTAREYFIFRSLREVWLPQNALQYFDIIHCDDGAGFSNHAAMAFGRGRFFVPTYIDPKFMTPADWHLYAGLLKWARRNQEVLRNTVVVTSRVELGEPYAYAHWDGLRGIIAVRNPSNETKPFILDLAKAGAPKGLSNAVCYVQYPYRKGILKGVNSASPIALDLAPWELLFLEIVPRAELLEPVAMGARWNRDSDGRMKVSPEDSSNIHILLPHGGEQVVTATAPAAGDLRGEITSQKIDRLPEANWLRHEDQPLPTASFELDCEVSIPKNATKGKTLLLLEFPGKNHLPSTCSCLVNGHETAITESTSEGHIGYDVAAPENPWRDLLPYTSRWTWYICDLESGSARVKFSGTYPYESCKLGLWTWADWDLTQQSMPVAIACPEPTMPQHQAHLKRQGICILSPGIPPAPPSSDGSWKVV